MLLSFGPCCALLYRRVGAIVHVQTACAIVLFNFQFFLERDQAKEVVPTSVVSKSNVEEAVALALAHGEREDDPRIQARCEALMQISLETLTKPYPLAMPAYLERTCEATAQPGVCARHARALMARDPACV